MKSAIQWFSELNVPYDGDITIHDIIQIQKDAQDDLKKQLEAARRLLRVAQTLPHTTPKENIKWSHDRDALLSTFKEK